MAASGILLSQTDDGVRTLRVRLYFPDRESGELMAESRRLQLYEGQSTAQVVLEALLAGPEDAHLAAVLPENTRVLSVRVDEGICYVNISQESLASLPQEESGQRLILWSLADSLYSVETINELRLVSNGEELTHFGLVPVDTVAVRPQG